MDWTPLLGRPRPAAPDALRLMAVVHQLGERRGVDGDGDDATWRLAGEETLIQLEHLVRRPRLLAHLLIHLFDQNPGWAERRATVSRRVRQLIELEERRGPRQRRPGALGASLDFPPPAAWRRFDDALAELSSRGLLRVELGDGGAFRQSPGLVYTLSSAGARLLAERFYSEGRDAARQLEVSGVVREFLPRWDGPWLRRQLDDARESVAAFRYAEQLPLERPVLPEIFLVTFDERL